MPAIDRGAPHSCSRADLIEQTIIMLLAGTFGIPAEEITPQSHLAADLLFDGLDQLEAAMVIDDAFDTAISDAEFASAETVADLVAIVMRAVGICNEDNPA